MGCFGNVGCFGVEGEGTMEAGTLTLRENTGGGCGLNASVLGAIECLCGG